MTKRDQPIFDKDFSEDDVFYCSAEDRAARRAARKAKRKLKREIIKTQGRKAWKAQKKEVKLAKREIVNAHGGAFAHKLLKFEPFTASGRLAIIKLVDANCWNMAGRLSNIIAAKDKKNPKAIKAFQETMQVFEGVGGNRDKLIAAAAKGKGKKVPHIAGKVKFHPEDKSKFDLVLTDKTSGKPVNIGADENYHNAAWLLPAIAAGSAIAAKLIGVMNKNKDIAGDEDEPMDAETMKAAQLAAQHFQAEQENAVEKSKTLKNVFIGGAVVVAIIGGIILLTGNKK